MQLGLWCCWDCKEAVITRVGRDTEGCLWECKDYKEKTKSLYDWMITRKKFHVWDKVLLYHSHLKLFPEKLHSHWIKLFVVSNIFSYSAVEITSLEINKVLKVNGYQLKTFYKGWTVKLSAFVELAKPIYEAWTCDMLSQT